MLALIGRCSPPECDLAPGKRKLQVLMSAFSVMMVGTADESRATEREGE